MCRVLVFFNCGAMPVLPFVKAEVLRDIMMRLRRSQPQPQACPVPAPPKQDEDGESSKVKQEADVPEARQNSGVLRDIEASDKEKRNEEDDVEQRDDDACQSLHNDEHNERKQGSHAMHIAKPGKKRVRFRVDEQEREQAVQGGQMHAETAPSEQVQEQSQSPLPHPQQQQRPCTPPSKAVETSTQTFPTTVLLPLPLPPSRPFPYPRVHDACTCTRLISTEQIPFRCGNCSTCNFRPAPLVFSDEHGPHAPPANPPTHTTQHGRFDPDERPAPSWGFTGRLEGGGWGRLGTVGGANSALSSRRPACSSNTRGSRRGRAARAASAAAAAAAPKSPSLGRLDASCSCSGTSKEGASSGSVVEERKKMKWIVGQGGEVVFRELKEGEGDDEQQEQEKREKEEEMIDGVFSRIDPVFRTPAEEKKSNGGGWGWFFSR